MAIKALCLALTLACAVTSAPESRIADGTPITIEEFPYIVALEYHFPASGIRVQRCVGSLISSWHVLTSSFCYLGAVLSNMQVRAGSTNIMSGGTVVNIRDVIKHPDYQQSPRTADIAIAVLEAPLGISDTINVLFLPPQGTHIPDGQSLKVVGWGFESMDGPQVETLQTINLRKVVLDKCLADYADKDGVVIDDRVICASEGGQISTCLGDHGAPMVINQVVVGLASYFDECNTDVYPNVFTRIDRFTDWILEVSVAPYSNNTVVRTRPVAL
ncbi:unnamed protein product [Parnassius mnemosyne]|uniref:Peptidase S1 domain-containing protein n=1 Tax=Parnassius mnemosyne TaxID=213953 RepID=A0AAV1LIZ7_9NEOP